MFGCALLFSAVVAVIYQVVAIVMIARRRDAARFGFALGAITLFLFAAYLTFVLWPRGIVPTWIIAFYFAPAALGLVTMLVALRARPRAGGGRLHVIVTGLAIVAITINVVMWALMETRSALIEAAKRGDARVVRRLLGVADSTMRQELLMLAAKAGDAPTLEVLIRSGVKPNVETLSHALFSADRLWKPATPEHALAAVNVLLDHGVDPTGMSVETPWRFGRDDIVRALRRKGARDDLPEQFEELMRASAAGDVDRVKALVTGRLLRYPTDAKGRSPFMAAIQNDRMEVARILLERYPEADGMILFAVRRAKASGDMPLIERLAALEKSREAALSTGPSADSVRIPP